MRLARSPRVARSGMPLRMIGRAAANVAPSWSVKRARPPISAPVASRHRSSAISAEIEDKLSNASTRLLRAAATRSRSFRGG